ncbi:MAG TPA: iron-containing alcohol dehydrogenase [Blastocatellia bacterium]|nr:iron-containing alcohol dehydrogenase [Blastocatellia bacterium]
MQPFDFQSRTRLVFGEGSFEQVGALARELGFKRTLIVADKGILACGYAGEASKLLAESGITLFTFHDFDSNPNTLMIEAGREFAAPLEIDSIIGLGGGSSMDTAKAINFLLTNGGAIEDYRGYGKARAPMLPMIGVPTTSGTGSEAQSYALISDAGTHVKMACGDPGAAFKVAILDPRLTVTQPPSVTAAAGFDAISHAVETYVTKTRTPTSEKFSLEAWRLLEPNYERVIRNPSDLDARGAMQLGAYWAGLAIENSMLGAAHACANPLTANYNTEHGVAIGLMLPRVVRWNGPVVGERYRELLELENEFVRPSGGSSYSTDRITRDELPPEGRTTNGGINSGDESHPGEALANRLEHFIRAGGLPRDLKSVGVPEGDLPRLAAEAASQWTGQHNPREFGEAEALQLYKCAYEI